MAASMRRVKICADRHEHALTIHASNSSHDCFRLWYCCLQYAFHASRQIWQVGVLLRRWRLYPATVPQGMSVGGRPG